MFQIDTKNREEGGKQAGNSYERQAESYSMSIAGNAANLEALKKGMSVKLGVSCFDMKIHKSNLGAQQGYTQNGQIYVNRELNLESPLGKRVLGHEMVHAAQQQSSGEDNMLLRVPGTEAQGFLDLNIPPDDNDTEYANLVTLYKGLKERRSMRDFYNCSLSAITYIKTPDNASSKNLTAACQIMDELGPVCQILHDLEGIIQTLKDFPSGANQAALNSCYDTLDREANYITTWNGVYEFYNFAKDAKSSFQFYDLVIKTACRDIFNVAIMDLNSRDTTSVFDELNHVFIEMLQTDEAQKFSTAQSVLHQLHCLIIDTFSPRIGFWYDRIMDLMHILESTAQDCHITFPAISESPNPDTLELFHPEYSSGVITTGFLGTSLFDYTFYPSKKKFKINNKRLRRLKNKDTVKVVMPPVTDIKGLWGTQYVMVILEDMQCGFVDQSEVAFDENEILPYQYQYPEGVTAGFDTSDIDTRFINPFALSTMGGDLEVPPDRDVPIPNEAQKAYCSPPLKLMYSYAGRIHGDKLLEHRMKFEEESMKFAKGFSFRSADYEEDKAVSDAADSFIESPNLRDATTLGKRGGFIIGEVHSESMSKVFLVRAMPQLKAAGIGTIYVEQFIWDNIQPLINEYMSKSSLELPEQIKRMGGMMNFRLMDALLYHAKLYGIRIMSLSTLQASNLGNISFEQRASRFITTNYAAKKVIEGDEVNRGGLGYVILAGSGHVHYHEAAEDHSLMPGLSQIFHIPAIKIEGQTASFYPPNTVTMDKGKRELTQQEKDLIDKEEDVTKP